MAGADRGNEPAAVGDLVEERFRDRGCGGGDDDPVVGSALGEAERPVADDHMNVCRPDRLQVPFRLRRHRRDPLHAPDFADDSSEHPA